MSIWNVGPKNGMWKGGRSVASNGYVLIRVGKNHHLADVRGYAYEHRLVAEKILGRRLRKGEKVHHEDTVRLNNRKSNLEVKKSQLHHMFHHRRSGKRLRNPGERNPLILCGCGCGGKIRRFDSSGRPRSFIYPHHVRMGLRRGGCFINRRYL